MGHHGEHLKAVKMKSQQLTQKIQLDPDQIFSFCDALKDGIELLVLFSISCVYLASECNILSSVRVEQVWLVTFALESG
jgi:hypothetical protein